MSPFAVQIQLEKTQYQPRELIRGTVTWLGDQAPRSAELQLLWRSEARGETDEEMVEPLIFDHPALTDERAFVFTPPIFPPSFSGRLIKLTWSVELFLNDLSAAHTELELIPLTGQISREHPEWITMEAPPVSLSWIKRTR